MARVIVAPLAQNDLAGISDDLADRNPATAHRLLDGMSTAFARPDLVPQAKGPRFWPIGR